MARPKKEESTVQMINDVKEEINNIEYKDRVIVVEPSRIVVAKLGLYVAEFDSVDQAKEYIDNVTA